MIVAKIQMRRGGVFGRDARRNGLNGTRIHVVAVLRGVRRHIIATAAAAALGLFGAEFEPLL